MRHTQISGDVKRPYSLAFEVDVWLYRREAVQFDYVSTLRRIQHLRELEMMFSAGNRMSLFDDRLARLRAEIAALHYEESELRADAEVNALSTAEMRRVYCPTEFFA